MSRPWQFVTSLQRRHHCPAVKNWQLQPRKVHACLTRSPRAASHPPTRCSGHICMTAAVASHCGHHEQNGWSSCSCPSTVRRPILTWNGVRTVRGSWTCPVYELARSMDTGCTDRGIPTTGCDSTRRNCFWIPMRGPSLPVSTTTAPFSITPRSPISSPTPPTRLPAYHCPSSWRTHQLPSRLPDVDRWTSPSSTRCTSRATPAPTPWFQITCVAPTPAWRIRQ